MPVTVDGRWESWETRRAREKAEREAAAEASAPVAESESVTEEPSQRTRTSKTAAEAAIFEATGVTVQIDDEQTDSSEQEQEPE